MTLSNRDFNKIAKATSVNEMLPFTFKNGSTRINSFTCDCGKCGQEIDQEHIRGETSSSNEHTVSFTGFAICYGCRTLTPVNVRFADDGSFLTKTETGWKRNMISIQEDPGLLVVTWRKLRSFVDQLLTKP